MWLLCSAFCLFIFFFNSKALNIFWWIVSLIVAYFGLILSDLLYMECVFVNLRYGSNILKAWIASCLIAVCGRVQSLLCWFEMPPLSLSGLLGLLIGSVAPSAYFCDRITPEK